MKLLITLILQLFIASSTFGMNVVSLELLQGRPVLNPTASFNFTSRNINLAFSKGSKTATFTASRGASTPATYIDENKVMQKTETSDVPRFTRYYYDTTGIHDYGKFGLLFEGPSTNYLPHSIFDTDAGSGISTGWGTVETCGDPITYSLVDASATFNVGATVNSQRFLYTGVAADATEDVNIISDLTAAGSFATDDYASFSVWIKGTVGAGVTLKIGIGQYDNGGGYEAEANSADLRTLISATEWRRFSVTDKLEDVDTDRIRVWVIANDIDDGESFDVQIACANGEKLEFPSSFIPTVAAALTRNTDSLTFATAGNRTAATETVVFKLAPGFPSASGRSAGMYLTDTNTKRRYVNFNSTFVVVSGANYTDSPDCSISNLINDNWVANVEMTIGVNMQQSSPYVAGYWDGVADGTNETADNFTTPAWGSTTYIGSSNSGSSNFYGVFFNIAFYDRILTAEQHRLAHAMKGIQVNE